MTRILIADDHSVVRRGLKQIVSECPGMKVTGEASTGQEALDLARKQDFDVAIVDIAMPGRGGLEILKDLRSEKPALKVVILSMYSEEQYAIRCLRDGAVAYLTKESAVDELVHAIQAVSGGGKYITASLAERLAEYIGQESTRGRHEALSDREFQVMLLIASGKSVGQIAKELVLSAKTISTYRMRVLAKLGLESNAELVRYAVERDLVK